MLPKVLASASYQPAVPGARLPVLESYRRPGTHFLNAPSTQTMRSSGTDSHKPAQQQQIRLTLQAIFCGSFCGRVCRRSSKAARRFKPVMDDKLAENPNMDDQVVSLEEVKIPTDGCVSYLSRINHVGCPCHNRQWQAVCHRPDAAGWTDK